MSDEINPAELRDSIRTFLRDRADGVINIPGEEGRGIDHALWAEMANLGWQALGVPEAHGGLGLGAEYLAVLYEELGRELASVPMLPTMMAAGALSAHADDAVQARWLPAIAGGECLASVALPDDNAELPVLADGRLSGAVDHVLFGDVANLLLLPARSGEAVVLVVIDAASAGVSVKARPVVDLTRSMGRITLSDVAVDSASVLNLDQAGWNALLDHAAMGLAVDCVGGAEALLDRTVEYLQIRQQFGRPIGSFQALKHRLADWRVKLEAITVLSRHVGALLSGKGDGVSATASSAKAYACDVYAAFAGDAIQLHGGIGFTWEHPCHLYLKRAKLSQQLFGSSTAHKERAARYAFDQVV